MTQTGIEYTVLYGAIGSLVTALIFLYNRTSRIEARLMSQLKSDSDKCEKEKVRMFTFITALLSYIAALNKVNCTAVDCPVRRLAPPMPEATAADMGMGDG